jgi:hypothetical protein
MEASPRSIRLLGPFAVRLRGQPWPSVRAPSPPQRRRRPPAAQCSRQRDCRHPEGHRHGVCLIGRGRTPASRLLFALQLHPPVAGEAVGEAGDLGGRQGEGPAPYRSAARRYPKVDRITHFTDKRLAKVQEDARRPVNGRDNLFSPSRKRWFLARRRMPVVSSQ